MKTPEPSHRARRLWAIVCFISPALFALPAFASGHRSEAWARNQFSNAEHMREALNGRPAQERSAHEYQRVINAYREVYYDAPTSTKAGASVVAVAELLVETGRGFNDPKALHSAIGQYEFLRREYPGSHYRFEALFTIGEIYKDDLGDAAHARATFEEFLRRYPHHHLAEDARAALAEPVEQAALRTKDDEDAKAPDELPDKNQIVSTTKDAKEHEGKLARVTSIRHWSTPNSTRVAVDLESEVSFRSQRIDGPDRIVFDLAETKLASTLVGKTFDVDDGFLKKIRVAQFQPGKTRVVLEVHDISDYHAFLLPNPTRLIIDIHGKQAAPGATAKTEQSSGEAEWEQTPAENSKNSEKDPAPTETDLAAKNSGVKKTIVEADDDSATAELEPPPIKPAAKSSSAVVPPQTSVVAKTETSVKSGTRRSASAKRGSTSVEAVTREAQPTANGDRSLTRALGLKIGKIVIDPGHGGHDTGTIGPNGLEEKDLVLDVSRRLGKLLQTRLGAEVVYTRNDDTFIPLETRTAIANQEQADLFVSVHANSSRDPDARGVETYYLNFTSSPDALEVAARENAVSEKSIHELEDLVKTIALKEKIDESREFATDVQRSLHSGLAAKSSGMRDRGVKKAPFIVLIGANMPSILAEISFVSNPGDERRLETPEYRQRIAESLYRGIAKYVNGLSGVKVASKIEKGEGQ
ncbi:MAG TPA: N-acetylmuramoyl-L-alanine amidase [Terriglobales bacterium]|nr:N-acetylmuramoyl-L-alanine amidase [Terriglobales bacterium]